MSNVTQETCPVFAAFDAYVWEVNGATRILREKLIALNVSLEEAEPYAAAWAAKRHNVPLVDGKGKAKGRKVLDANAPGYEAARKARQRMMDALSGNADADINAKAEEGAEAEEFDVPAEIAAAAAKLVALVNEYDMKKGALKSLASRAVAEAFAAAFAK